MRRILACRSCGIYTLQAVCPKCGNPSINPAPARYSPDDKYGSYRRTVKEPSLREAGLL
ncbi:MAG TPA: RNA-protein complex protein Nop10 [Candidatus Nanoarchaeia archaeon]|nr:RNA-protein complex protein Nop10 [Candidatus Nanoarchaeia archaeon]